jgi:pimeloyl-ACP methyl ester carboxylesterase
VSSAQPRAVAILFAFAIAGCATFHQGPMPGEPKNATYETIDGARIRYVDLGSGPAVVLIHGFASSLETWLDVMPELAKTHRVIALDLKGFGWSDRPEGDYSPKAEASIVLHLLDARGVDSAAFVAHSWGASVALAAALEAPERVTRLVLYDAFVYEEQINLFFHLSRVDGVGEALFALYYKQRPDEKLALAFYDRSFISEPLVEAVEQALERPGTTAAALAAVRGQRYAEVEAKYRTIKTPALLLWGREDRVTPLAIGERLQKDLLHAQLISYPRCGHLPMIEAKNPSNADLYRFLDHAAAGGGLSRTEGPGRAGARAAGIEREPPEARLRVPKDGGDS